MRIIKKYYMNETHNIESENLGKFTLTLKRQDNEKNIIITGGAKGIGRCCIEKFLINNYNVIVIDKILKKILIIIVAIFLQSLRPESVYQ